MSYNGPTYNGLASQSEAPPVFIERLASQQSVAVAPANEAGVNYQEIPRGTVLCKTWAGLYRPCAHQLVNGVVTAAAAVILGTEKASSFKAFNVGDWLFIEGQTFPVKITARAVSTKTLTVDRNVTIADDAGVFVDPSVSVATLGADTSVNEFTFQTAGDYAKFRVGDVVQIEGVTGARNVTAIDTGANTITVDGAAGSTSAGARIISQARGDYRIATETRYTVYGYDVEPSNVMMPTCDRGEVFAKRVRGLTSTIRAALILIDFNEMIAP